MADKWLDGIIDISHWNNNGNPINWAIVDPAIVLVFAKASQGANSEDKQFVANKTGCLATGRMFVPYHFIDSSDPDAQIANFEQHLESGKPFALDWEGRRSQTAIPEDVEYIGLQIADDMRWAVPIGYWGIPGSTPDEPTDVMKSWTRWVPRYPVTGLRSFADMPEDKQDLIDAPFWQYTAWGTVSGISGTLDRSVWKGTLDELQTWYNKAGA